MEELGDSLLGIANGNQVHMAMVDEALVFVRVFVNAYGYDGQVGAVVMELEKRRCFLNAGSTPCGPKIKQDHFAAIVGQVDGCASVGDGEVRRRGGELGGVGTAIARGEQGERQGQDEGEETRRPHTSIIRSESPQRKGG